MLPFAGVDLSKNYFGGCKPKYWREQKVVITDEGMDVSQFFGSAPGLPSKSTPMLSFLVESYSHFQKAQFYLLRRNGND